MTTHGDEFFIPGIERTTIMADAQIKALKARFWWDINHPVKAMGVKSNKKPGWRRG